MARSLSPGRTTVAGVLGGRMVSARLRAAAIGALAVRAVSPSSSIVRAAWVAMMRFSWARSLMSACTARAESPWWASVLAASMRTAGDSSVRALRRSFLVSIFSAFRWTRPSAAQ